MDVVRLFVRGLRYREVADLLGLSYESVKTYAARIRQKLELNTKVEVVLWALKNKEFQKHERIRADQRRR